MKKQPEADRNSDKDQDGIPDFIDSSFNPELYEYVEIKRLRDLEEDYKKSEEQKKNIMMR